MLSDKKFRVIVQDIRQRLLPGGATPPTNLTIDGGTIFDATNKVVNSGKPNQPPKKFINGGRVTQPYTTVPGVVRPDTWVGGEIISRDLTVSNLQMIRTLSGPCTIEFDVDYHDPSVAGIKFKPWGQLIHIEREILGRRKIWVTGIVQPSEVDKKTGVLHLRAMGFSYYPKELPWLEDWNPITCDAFEPVHKIWNHIQSYKNGDLGVSIYPTESGIELLPGYAYDGDILSFDFYAQFIRQDQKRDCWDHINGLSRDVPFDYIEHSKWNADRTDIDLSIELAYPRAGYLQTNLAFVLNENVFESDSRPDPDIDFISDIGVSGYFPGKEYSFELANADPTRIRRYLKEDDAQLNSNERAAAWAKRHLARRQTPAYWDSIIVDMEHPNAPFGYYDVGDTIIVRGFMPWEGEVEREHKITAITISEKEGICELKLKAEGAFNYDPIYFPNNISNILDNFSFDQNISGWTAGPAGQETNWKHDAAQGVDKLGTACFTASGVESTLSSQLFTVNDMIRIPCGVWVKADKMVESSTIRPVPHTMRLDVLMYKAGRPFKRKIIAGVTAGQSIMAWTRLQGTLFVEDEVDKVQFILVVTSDVKSGTVWWDDAEMTL
jgi:hypothetical protein